MKPVRECQQKIKNLNNFQTLHSFGYKTLGLDESRILQPEHYQTFGKRIGVRVKYTDRLNKQEIPYLRSDNPYFKLNTKSRKQTYRTYIRIQYR